MDENAPNDEVLNALEDAQMWADAQLKVFRNASCSTADKSLPRPVRLWVVVVRHK